MLTPFNAYVRGGPAAASRDDASALGRSIRDAMARYQSDTPLQDAVSRGDLIRMERPVLVRYTVTGPTGSFVEGLVGKVPLSALVPHEELLPYSEARRWRRLEIRPLLAFTSADLPPLEPIGPTATVNDGALVHSVVPVEAPATLALDRLILADGHHRRRAGQLAGVESAMTLVVGGGGEGLRAAGFHRQITGVGKLPVDAGELFIVEEHEAPLPHTGGLVWVQPGSPPLRLMPRAEALEAILEPLRRIPAAFLAELFEPLLGEAALAATHHAMVADAVAGLGPEDAAILLPRVSLARVEHAALSGTLLPPKGTRFTPKPVRGLVMST